MTRWDFERDGAVTLNGEWEFYWRHLLSPADFAAPNYPQPTGFMTLPAAWNGYMVGGQSLTGNGYATYRLTLRMPPLQQATALRVPDMDTAYILYVNGQEISRSGVVGVTAETTAPEWRPQLFNFTPDNPPRQIIFQVANFDYRNGGLTLAIQLGTPEQIQEMSHGNVAFDLFLCGSILIMGFYHLGLFTLRRRDKSPLYFSLCCFAIALRILTTGEFFLIQIFPSIPWKLLVWLAFVSVYCALFTFILFVHSLYPQETPRWLLYASHLLNGFFFTLSLVTPTQTYTAASRVYEVALVMSCLWTIYALVRAWLNRREGAAIFLVGFLILSFTVVNDVLRANGLIRTNYLGPFGIFAFIFCQSFLLSIRFAKAFVAVEDLSVDLEAKNQQLLQVMESQQALITIQQELAIARQIQQGLLPPPNPGWSELKVICYSMPAHEVGGDFYSYHAFAATPCHRYAVTIGDVSGKGVSAALLMAASLAEFNATLALELSPSERLVYLDQAIMPYTKWQNCAMCYVEIITDPTQNEARQVTLHMVNAGGIPPYIKFQNGEVEQPDISGFPLGQGLGTELGYQMRTIPLTKGDLVVLTTDGVVEAFNPMGEIFGFERLEQTLKATPLLEATTLLEHLRTTLENFVDGAEQHDDVTIIVIQI